MRRELVFISAQPDESYYIWQLEVCINNFRSLGYKEEIQVLFFTIKEPTKEALNLQARYAKKNIKVFWYKRSEEYLNSIQDYVPLLRTEILAEHFDKYPKLKNKAIFYHDSDIIFTRKWDIAQFKNDSVNYMSNTQAYMGPYYFESRWRYVKPEYTQQYADINPLVGACNLVGIDADIVIENASHTGGAQCILKDIDGNFWRKIGEDALKIRRYFKDIITPLFFDDTKEGFANGWCADMWALLWNLWLRGSEVRTPKEMDFAWPHTLLEHCNQNIYHDTGVTEEQASFLFYKKREDLIFGSNNPFKDDLSYVRKEYSSSLYAKAITEVANKFYNN